MIIYYYAVFEYDVDGISITFPDVPSAISCAFTDVEAVKMAQEALSLALHGQFISDLPMRTDVITIEEKNNDDSTIMPIAVGFEIHNGRLFDPYVKECRKKRKGEKRWMARNKRQGAVQRLRQGDKGTVNA